MHGIPGLIGGLVSAVVAAAYAHPSTLDAYKPADTSFPQLATLLATPYKQGGLQIAITFCSLGIGIVTSIITGFFLKICYSWKESEFFNDSIYFEEADEFLSKEEFNPEFVKKEIRALTSEFNLQLSQERLQP